MIKKKKKVDKIQNSNNFSNRVKNRIQNIKKALKKLKNTMK